MKKLNLILAGMFVLATAAPAFAHPGGLDEDGGHMDAKTGKYHFHKDAKGSKLDTPVEVANHVKGEKYEGGGKVTKAEAPAAKAPKAEKKAKKGKKEKAEAVEAKDAKAEVKDAKPAKEEAKAEKKDKKEKKGKKAKKEKKDAAKDAK